MMMMLPMVSDVVDSWLQTEYCSRSWRRSCYLASLLPRQRRWRLQPCRQGRHKYVICIYLLTEYKLSSYLIANRHQATILNFVEKHISSQNHFFSDFKFCEDRPFLNHIWGPSCCKWKIFSTAVLTLNFDLDLSKVKSDILGKCWTSVRA